MSRKDYVRLAEIAGRTLAAASWKGGEAARTVVYDEFYSPLVDWLAEGNSRFDRLLFAHATAVVEEGFALDRAEARAGTQ